MSLDWYPWWLQPWRRNTRHLTLAEKGAYRELCDEYMASGEALPDNDRALASTLGCMLDEWLAVAPAVRSFFSSTNGRLIHERCEQELHAQRMRSASRTAKAKAAAAARWNKINHLNATSMPVAMLNDATIQSKIDKKETTNGKFPIHPTAELIILESSRKKKG